VAGLFFNTAAETIGIRCSYTASKPSHLPQSTLSIGEAQDAGQMLGEPHCLAIVNGRDHAGQLYEEL
jgi:hypothetical protein